MGLLHADSSGQSQREHPASGAGSAPGRGGGGRASLPPMPTKPWQPGLAEMLVPRIFWGGWVDRCLRTQRQVTAAREALILQRQLAKAAVLGARAAWPSHDPAPSSSSSPARLPVPAQTQKSCGQPPFCLPERTSSCILPIHGLSTPWQGILPAPKSPLGLAT